MIKDSDKFSQRIKWLENLFNFDDGSFKYIFWFFSILTIPIFAYLYTLPLSLLLWLIAEWFDLSENFIDVFTNFGVIVCFIAAFVTQFQIWKIYKNKKAPDFKNNT